jgi:hypothetical protein
MNTRQLNFVYRVRHALNENLEHLPQSTIERLASTRKLALSLKKPETPKRQFVRQRQFAGNAGGFSGKRFSWIARLGMAAPLIVLVSGLVTIYQVEQQRRIGALAEIDALVLSDELPLSAYIDHGFNAYLANRED